MTLMSIDSFSSQDEKQKWHPQQTKRRRENEEDDKDDKRGGCEEIPGFSFELELQKFSRDTCVSSNMKLP